MRVLKKQGQSAEKSCTSSHTRKSAFIEHCHPTHRLHSMLLVFPTMSLINHPFLLVPESNPQLPIAFNFYVSIATFKRSLFPCFFLTLEEHRCVALLNDLQFVVDWHFLKITSRVSHSRQKSTEVMLCSQWIPSGANHVHLSHWSWCWLYCLVKMTNYEVFYTNSLVTIKYWSDYFEMN